MQAPQVQKRRKLSVLARKAAKNISGGSTRLSPSTGPHHPASHAWHWPSCPTTAAWGAPVCGSPGWSIACIPGMELLAGSKRNEGRGSDHRNATGTCHHGATASPSPRRLVGSCAHRTGRERGRRCVRKDLMSSVAVGMGGLH